MPLYLFSCSYASVFLSASVGRLESWLLSVIISASCHCQHCLSKEYFYESYVASCIATDSNLCKLHTQYVCNCMPTLHHTDYLDSLNWHTELTCELALSSCLINEGVWNFWLHLANWKTGVKEFCSCYSLKGADSLTFRKVPVQSQCLQSAQALQIYITFFFLRVRDFAI